ncbi:MAG: bifunctional 4-hydroxy-2-oxoglutarate aldolase/2-dehydro-3-deoxy-phosphogluconate aldolase [Oligoflexus sp.]
MKEQDVISPVIASNSQEMERLLAKSPVLPVMTIPELSDAVPVAKALVSAGLRIIEVTLRTDCAISAIKAILHEIPGICVGGGTVTSVQQLETLHAIGASFAVSPGLTVDLLRRAKAIGMPYLPGITSVSELMLGMSEGYECFKFFPAVASGGVATLKSLAGPFSQVKFCPTGGINQDNFAEYYKLSNVVSVGGSWLTPQKLIEAKDWPQIQKISEQFLAECSLSS